MDCKHEVIRRVQDDIGWAYQCEQCEKEFVELNGELDRDAQWINALVNVIRPQFMHVLKQERLSLEMIVAMFVEADRRQQRSMIQ